MNQKKWISIWLGVLAILPVIGLFNYIIDPFQHYRLANWYKIRDNEHRYLVPGLIRHLHVDSVIMGTSVTENFSTIQIHKELGWNVRKLSIPAMSAYEADIIFKQLFTYQKDIKNILLSMDIVNTFNVGIHHLPDKSLPLYLYDENIFNDYKYLCSLDTTERSVNALVKYANISTNWDKFFYWGDRKFSKDEVLRGLKEKPYIHGHVGKNYVYKQCKNNFDKHILPYLQAHPNIQFYLFYPPYSSLVYFKMNKEGWLEDTFKFKKYVYQTTKNYKNIHIYDFECMQNITSDLNNYKDPVHYSAKINDLIIKRIVTKDYLYSNSTQCNDKIKQEALSTEWGLLLIK